MKIERILYGMQTSDGKILSKYTDGVLKLLQPKSRESIKALQISQSRKPLWFKTEQVLAYPIIIEVEDKHPDHGGRSWVQNQTFLVHLTDFLEYALNNGSNPFEKLTMGELDKFPESFDSLEV
jgi:hypothetical protein